MSLLTVLDWIAANPAAASALVAFAALVIGMLEKVFGLFSRLFGRRKASKTPGNGQSLSHQSGQAIQARDISGGITLTQGLDPSELVDRLLAERDRATMAEARAEALEGERAALLKVLEALQARVREGEEPDRAQTALRHLAENNPAEAEAIFREILEAKRLASDHAKIEAAAAARHLGALAFLHDTEAALAAYEEAVELDPLDAGGLNNLAEIYKRLGRLDDAERTFERLLAAKDLFNDDDTLRAIALGNLGRIAQTRGDRKRALELQAESAKISEKLERFDLLAANLTNLGLLFYDENEMEQAEKTFKQSLALEEAFENEEGMATDYSNLGLVYLARDELAAAKEMFDKALALDRKLGNQEGEAVTLGNLGDVALFSDDFQQADHLFQSALAMSRRLGFREGEADCLSRLGDLAEKQGDIPAARRHWTAARDLYTEIGIIDRPGEMEACLARVVGLPKA